MPPTDDDSTPIRHSEAFPVKPPVSWVVFPRWPKDGDDWIHPDDREKVKGLIPSDFIFRREMTDDDWYMLTYGDVQIKTRPVMVDEVAEPKFQVGELVELDHQLEVDKMTICKIYAVRFSDYFHEPQYYVIRGDLKSQQPYLAKDLKPYEPPKPFHAMHEYEP